MPEMTGWEAVVLAMKAEGVPYVFGLPGDPRHLYDALVAAEPDGGPRPIGVRFETSGAFMAMAYARVTNQIAACFGCPGPGIANLVPGILEAYSGCTPMLVLGVRAPRQTYGKGAVPGDRPRRHALLDHQVGDDGRAAGEHPLGDAPRRPARHQRSAGSGLRRAARRHRSGRLGDPRLYARRCRAPRPAADPPRIAAAADLIAAAKRPLLITGGGAILSGAGSAVGELSRHGSASRSRRRRPAAARWRRRTRSSAD